MSAAGKPVPRSKYDGLQALLDASTASNRKLADTLLHCLTDIGEAQNALKEGDPGYAANMLDNARARLLAVGRPPAKRKAAS